MKTAFFFLIIFLFGSAKAQETGMSHEDSARTIGHVYYVKAWTSIGITAAGALAIVAARFSPLLGKPEITNQEFDVAQSPASRNSFNALDKWALNLSFPKIDYQWYGVGLQIGCAAAPLALFFGDRFRKNWDDIILMLMELNAVTSSIFQFSPIGPLFQNRYRPMVYFAFDSVARDSIKNGGNRNSFYSGHVASATASTYFMAKVYCDYHPEITGWDKIGIYALASVPPLVMGYFRLIALKHFTSDILTGFVVGGVCGVALPEIHRIAGKDVSFCAYSSPSGSGVSLSYNFK